MPTYTHVHEDLETIAQAAAGAPFDIADVELRETIYALAREIQRLRAEIVELNDDSSEATAMVVTRRLVIVDTEGQTRITLDGGSGNVARLAMLDPDLRETFRLESDAEGTALHVMCGHEAGGKKNVQPRFVAAMHANPTEEDWGHVSVYTPDDEYVKLAGAVQR